MSTAEAEAGAGLDYSIVIPVYNEESVLETLFERIYPVLDKLGCSYEIVFVDDGSRDRSAAMLRAQYQKRPDATHVLFLRSNAGQHAAIIAGFQYSRGRTVVTLDADLQNPPEEIPKLIEQVERGHDYVGTIRRKRNDTWWRHRASRLMNWLREKITNIQMTDQGCMLRAYDREIVDAILESRETNTFIPALAYLYAGNPTEVVVEHDERLAGESKYSLFKLIHLNFDLMTGFSLMPLQVFSIAGIAVSMGSFLFVLYMAYRRLAYGPEEGGTFTLFAIMFFLIGIILFGIGLLGEYVGRIYTQARERPHYLIRCRLGGDSGRDSCDQ